MSGRGTWSARWARRTSGRSPGGRRGRTRPAAAPGRGRSRRTGRPARCRRAGRRPSTNHRQVAAGVDDKHVGLVRDALEARYVGRRARHAEADVLRVGADVAVQLGDRAVAARVEQQDLPVVREDRLVEVDAVLRVGQVAVEVVVVEPEQVAVVLIGLVPLLQVGEVRAFVVERDDDTDRVGVGAVLERDARQVADDARVEGREQRGVSGGRGPRRASARPVGGVRAGRRRPRTSSSPAG